MGWQCHNTAQSSPAFADRSWTAHYNHEREISAHAGRTHSKVVVCLPIISKPHGLLEVESITSNSLLGTWYHHCNTFLHGQSHSQGIVLSSQLQTVKRSTTISIMNGMWILTCPPVFSIVCHGFPVHWRIWLCFGCNK